MISFPSRSLRRWASLPLLGLVVATGCSTDRFVRSTSPQPAQPFAHVPPAVAQWSHPPATDHSQNAGATHIAPAGHEVADEPNALFPADESDAAGPALTAAASTDASAHASADEIPLPPPAGSAESDEDSEADLPQERRQTAAQGMPIDLATALGVAGGRNPQVQFAYQRIQEALADLQRAEVLWLPSLRAGANYNKHEGIIQDVEGDAFDVSRGAAYTGFGAGAVGAGSPAVHGLSARFHLTDAVFQPRIAERAAAATQYSASATLNDTLRDVALAYLDLLEAAEQQGIALETVINVQQLADLTESFARTGQGTQADADRVQTELAIRENDVARAEEDIRVASARLARLLSQDPTLLLVPAEPTAMPIELVSPQTPLEELVTTGLSNRPELAESQLLVSAAVQRLERERYAPLIPSLLLGTSYGGFGGGTGSDLDPYKDRFDLDVAAFWEVRNLGFGEQAARDAARTRVDQARWQQVRVMDQVASEVTQSHAQVQARRRQIETAKRSIQSARDAYRRDMQRIREGAALPIEALQSIQALNNARREYLRAVIDYNEAQFRLHWALGCPVQ